VRELESEAMAKHTSKQAKTKPEPKVDPGTTKKAVANSVHGPQRRNLELTRFGGRFVA
jgi:hypothetical protein